MGCGSSYIRDKEFHVLIDKHQILEKKYDALIESFDPNLDNSVLKISATKIKHIDVELGRSLRMIEDYIFNKKLSGYFGDFKYYEKIFKSFTDNAINKYCPFMKNLDFELEKFNTNIEKLLVNCKGAQTNVE